jgi:uncharacterized protein involved in exopolysaccharide biosynthesis
MKVDQVRTLEDQKVGARGASLDAEDEIDLRVLVIAVQRRRYLVLVLLLSGLIAGTALGFMGSPLYESRAVLQIGRVGGVGPVQTSTEVVQSLRQAHRIDDPTLRGRPVPYIRSVEQIAEGTVLVTALGRTPEEGRAFLAAELDKILRDHAAMFQEVTATKDRAREALTARLAAIESQARTLFERAESVAPRNPELGAVLTQEQIRLSAEFADLTQSLRKLELELSRMATSQTRVLQQPTIAEAPEGRAKRLLPAAGAAAGLIVGIVAAMVLEAFPRQQRLMR